MLNRVARRWRGGLSLGLGLPLLLGSAPAAAAGAWAWRAGGLTPWLGVAAALWALLGLAACRPGPSGACGRACLRPARRARSGPGVFSGATREIARGRGRTRASEPTARPLRIPAGLDGEAVLDVARGRFMRLQAAWDAGDISALKSLTTPEMLEELLHVLDSARRRRSRTDVITLHAELLGLEELSAAYLASVEFSGLIRESAERGAVPFRELWMLACMKDESSSWRLARQQSLF